MNRESVDYFNNYQPPNNRRIILKWVFKEWCESMDWIDLAQDRDDGGCL
jgi:hypothetical protein